MHVEIQVALNFVISYLYNKLPRRRVNLFGEELEKALKDKFQGHWYPEKPVKGSAFRCLKTGDPIDAVLDRAARESGVPIADILENLPAELSVWVDPREVSYRIGEKGAVKILYSEASSNDMHEESSSSADREVTKTFNPEAQCFRPIEAVSTSLSGLSLSPNKNSPQGGTPPNSSTSPIFKGPLSNSPAPPAGNGPFLPRSQAPLTFTTATFAQTKFGSTKLKTSSKRANRENFNNFRMSPTEFSNYIKQRAMQQQLHHSHGGNGVSNGHLAPIGPSSPSRSLSPNPIALGMQNDPYFYTNGMGIGTYTPPFGAPRNMFDTTTHYHPDAGNNMYGSGPGKYYNYVDSHNYYGMGATPGHPCGPVHSPTNIPTNNGISGGSGGSSSNSSASSTSSNSSTSTSTPGSSPGTNQDSKIMDGLNSFYSNNGSHLHLLVAN